MTELTRDSAGFLDLTGVDAPRFRFKYIKEVNGKAEVILKELDVEWVHLQLYTHLPTAFRMEAHTFVDVVDGAEVERKGELPGLCKAFLLLGKGEALPPHLPSVPQIVVAVRRAMSLPDDFPTNQTLILLTEFLNELNRIDALKKGMPGSPGSSAPSPVA